MAINLAHLQQHAAHFMGNSSVGYDVHNPLTLYDLDWFILENFLQSTLTPQYQGTAAAHLAKKDGNNKRGIEVKKILK